MTKSNTIVLRDAELGDYSALRELNEASVPHMNSLDSDRFASLMERCSSCRVALLDAAIVGGILVMSPGLDYESENYQWFSKRYDTFAYVDRVMVSVSARRRGVASLLYRDLEASAKARSIKHILCEYNLEPPNPVSQEFHARLGFSEVGRQRTAAEGKLVSLQCQTISTS
jgi:predicted GNAT superfamily acetyltransferase